MLTHFKCEAAALVIDQDYTYPVGVGESALRRWVKQHSEERTGRLNQKH